MFFFFKQKTAYEVRISDWSSDVCSSDLRLAKLTDGYSGADLAHICESAAEIALMDSVETGNVRMITMADMEAALRDVRPSIGPWMETARNVALYANEYGEYDELAKFLRKRGRG